MRQVQTLSKASRPGTRDRGLARAVPRGWPPDAAWPLGVLQVCEPQLPTCPQVGVFMELCLPCNGSGGPGRNTRVHTGLCSGVKGVTLNITSRSSFQRRPPPPCSEAGALNGRDFQNLGSTKCSPLSMVAAASTPVPLGPRPLPPGATTLPWKVDERGDGGGRGQLRCVAPSLGHSDLPLWAKILEMGQEDSALAWTPSKAPRSPQPPTIKAS